MWTFVFALGAIFSIPGIFLIAIKRGEIGEGRSADEFGSARVRDHTTIAGNVSD